MRLYFRPMPGFTMFAAVMLAVLLGLGIWQIQRLHWKLGLIAEVKHGLTLPPVSLDRAIRMGAAAEYRHVALDGHFLNSKEAYFYTTGPEGDAVYHVLTPFVTDDGRTLMVDRGMVPEDLRDPATRRAGLLGGERHIVAVWRMPDEPGFFTPAPDLAHHVWFSRDVSAMAAADGIKLAAPVVLEADAVANPGGWPKGGQTQVTFRNEHLAYAITWFGLAIGLLGIYLVFHVEKDRLRFR